LQFLHPSIVDRLSGSPGWRPTQDQGMGMGSLVCAWPRGLAAARDRCRGGRRPRNQRSLAHRPLVVAGQVSWCDYQLKATGGHPSILRKVKWVVAVQAKACYTRVTSGASICLFRASKDVVRIALSCCGARWIRRAPRMATGVYSVMRRRTPVHDSFISFSYNRNVTDGFESTISVFVARFSEQHVVVSVVRLG